MRYTASSERERRRMLEAVGARGVEDLFASVPEEDRSADPLDVRGPVPEGDLLRELHEEQVPLPRASLVGAGLYHHYIPPTAHSLAARSEWVTSYTPYQAEISQGTLVMYYEFQTWVALLTGQEVANGGMYDGSTALAEAVLMARRLRPRARRVLVSEGLHPEYMAVLRTFVQFQDLELELLPLDRETGRTRLDRSSADQRDALALVLQTPNFLGLVEDAAGLDPDAFLISVCTEAQSLALLKPLPARISVGEIQSLGIPVQLGGPTAGFFATRKEYVRRMPGRLVARTRDMSGGEAYCITLATREQFIRREKATSNICTSSGLMCLRAVVFMALMGSAGLQQVARMSARAARAFAAGVADMGLATRFPGPWFNEMVLDASSRPGLYEALKQHGFIMGVPLERWFPDMKEQYLVCLTELHYPKVKELVQEVKDRAREL